MSTLLYLHDTPKGKIISKQVDFHSFESILYSWPFVGNVLEGGFRRFMSWQIIQPTAFVAKAWPTLESALRALPVIERNWEGIVGAARKFWWKKEGKTERMQLAAPYDPSA